MTSYYTPERRMMRISAVSDTHGSLPAVSLIPDCELLLLAGDIEPCRGKSTATIPIQADWLNTTFRVWMNELWNRNIKVLAIPGNHSFVFEQYPGLVSQEVRDIYLIDRSVTFNGLNIHGLPWTNRFGDWAYNADDNPKGRNPIKRYTDLIPANTDILISHGPPCGYGDNTDWDERGGLGSYNLLNRIRKLTQLKLCVYGHLHNSGGKQYNLDCKVLANVAYLDDHYFPWGHPLPVWEI